MQNSPSKTVIISILLALVTFALFLPVRHHQFINFDDDLYVSQNRHVQAGLTGDSIRWAFQINDDGKTYWHPLTWLSHMLDCQLFGLQPGVHHLVNVLFHIANTLALFWLLKAMTAAFWPSAVVAAIFALHPLQVDTVAWVAERKNLLSTVLWILTVAAYLQYARQPSMFRYSSVIVLFGMGLMAKPMLVTLPCVLLLLDIWPLGRMGLPKAQNRHLADAAPGTGSATWMRLIVEKIPLFILAGLSSAITLLMHKRLGLILSADHLSIGSRLENASISYVRYIGKTLWPRDLAIFYPLQAEWSLLEITSAVLLLISLTGIAIWQIRARPYFAVGWFWFLGTLVPVIGFVQVNEQAMADRFAYVPLIGLLIAITWGVTQLCAHWQLRSVVPIAVALLAISASTACTVRQITYWKTSETVFAHAIAVTRRNAVAHVGLGLALADKREFKQALEHLSEALQIKPNSPEIHVMIGQIQVQQGDVTNAIASYSEAVRYNPDFPEGLNNLAWLLATSADSKLRNGTQAVLLAERACDLTDYKKAIMIGTLAAAYAEAGRFSDAIRTAQAALVRAVSSREKNIADKNAQLIELYRRGEAYHSNP